MDEGIVPPKSFVDDSLSTEEVDQLARSNKRVKKVRILLNRPASLSTEGQSMGEHINKEVEGERGKRKLTFRDTILGHGAKVVLVDPPEGHVRDEMDVSDDDDEGLETDDIHFSKEQLRRFRSPWKSALIVKVLGRKVGYQFLKQRLIHLWKPKGGFKLVSIGYDYYIVKFELLEDREVVLRDGPWTVLNHYLAVRRWVPNFRPSVATIDRATLWVRIPDFPMEFANEEGLRAIGDFIGKTVKIDVNTKANEFGNFARLCVEVDLTKSLKPFFTLLGSKYMIQYEGVHLICFRCGTYGHKSEDCSSLGGEKVADHGSMKETTKVVENGEVNPLQSQAESPAGNKGDECASGYGPWTLVGKQRRKVVDNKGGKSNDPRQRSSATRGDVGGSTHSGSRFKILEEVGNNIERVSKETVVV